MHVSPEEARSALADLDRQRAELAREVQVPFARHLAFALVMAFAVASMSHRALMGLAPVAIVATVMIILWDRRRYGLFINGYRRGRTLPLTIVQVAVVLAGALAALWGREHGLVWVGLGAAAATFLASLGISYAWQEVYRRELEG